VDTSFGRRATDWELKGIPVRVEVGPRDLAEGNVTIVRRDQRDKETVAVAGAAARVADVVRTMQDELLAAATARRDERIATCSTLDEARDAAQAGLPRVPGAGGGRAGEGRDGRGRGG